MNEDTKQAFIGFTSGMIIILGAILMVTSCVKNQDDLNHKLSIICIERGGEMVLVPGKSDTYYCKQK